MKTLKLIFATLGLLLIPNKITAAGPQPNSEYERLIFEDSVTKVSMPYRMLAPENKESDQKYPLVLFLHGSGERGTDNERQLIHGASIFSNPANMDKYPAYVVFPQCKEKSWTGRIDARSFMPGAPTPEITLQEETIIAMVKDLIHRYPIDTNRIYIVGMSMGGIAAYDLVCRYPEMFAAAIPICGAVNPERLACAKDVNFMIFHGEVDEEVPSICGREAYKALNEAGANVDYIEFAGIGHECWSSAFNYPTFMPWLFSQTKDDSTEPFKGTLTYMY